MSLIGRPLGDLVDAGVQAYRARNYKVAAEHLQCALDQDPQQHRARLYLGMSLYYGGDLLLANAQFRTLMMNCPDREIKEKAETAIAAMQTQIAAMPDMTCTIKKPKIAQTTPPAPKAEEDEEDGLALEWVESEYKNNNT
jgi:hypothetical protein